MPIYAYKCATCGHEKDVLQKVSDAPPAVCPACGAATFVKQVTAAGFQLKGSGWYATDFRDGGKKKDDAAKDKAAEAPASASAEKKTDGASSTDSKTAAESSTKSSDTKSPSAESGGASSGGAESKSATKPSGPPPATGA